MKKSLLTLAILIFSFWLSGPLQSCNKIKDAIAKNLGSFSWTQASMTFDVPVVSSTSQFAQYDTVVVNIDQVIHDNAGTSFSINDISKITINQIILHLNNADANNNWTNFSTASSIIATSKSNANGKSALIDSYSISDIPANQYNDIVLNGNSNVNIKDYFDGSATSVYYLVSAQARRATTIPLNVTVTVTYSFTP